MPTTANIPIGRKNGEKESILFMGYLKKSRPLIFYCAPILSREDNVLLIRNDRADSSRRGLQPQVHRETAGDNLTIYNTHRPSGHPNDGCSCC